MPKLLFLKGLPGSGKSSWCFELMEKHPNSYKRVNKDSLREMIDNNYFSKDSEKAVVKAEEAIILKYLELGKNVIVDNTHLAPKHEERIRQLVKGKADFVIKDFTDIDVEECIKRDLKREKSVGEKVIRGMHEQFLAPPIPVIEYNPKLPDCIICDLDGTLCHLNGRNPYDASACEEDLPNKYLISIIKNLWNYEDCNTNRLHLIFLSGREDKYRNGSENWIINNLGNYPFTIYMRPTNDFRKDSIVKEELYCNHIEGKYNVVAVFDDRKSVCEMWYRLGLPLFRVGNPNAEF